MISLGRESSRNKHAKHFEATGRSSRSQEGVLPPGLGGVPRASADPLSRNGTSLSTDPPRKKRFKASSSPSPHENAGAVARGAALPPHLLHNGTEASTPTRSASPHRMTQSTAGEDKSTRVAHSAGKGKQSKATGQEIEAAGAMATSAGGGHSNKSNSRRFQAPYAAAVAKLRLYLAASMLQAVRSSPNGGFGIPISFVLRDMSTEFGEDLVACLFHGTTHTAVILNECGDIVEIIPLTVGQAVKNGCVPSTQFRRDSTNIEARIRQDSIAIIARAEGSRRAAEFEMKVQRRMAMDFFQQAGDVEISNQPLESTGLSPRQADMMETEPQKELMPATALYEMVRRLMETVVQDILANPKQFPTVSQFSERFRQEYEVELNPRVAGFESVLEMLQGMELHKLIGFRKFRGDVFIVPTSQALSSQIRENPPIAAGEDRMVEDSPCPRKPNRNKNESEKSLPAPPTALASNDQTTIPVEIPPPPPPPPLDSGPRLGHSLAESKEHESTTGVTRSGEKVRDISVQPVMEPVHVAGGDGMHHSCTAFHTDDEFDEFDTEILNKLRSLFIKTICKDQKPICLNRLPLVFLRQCGSILDYQKYGYINLTDVVSLLSDIVKVVDTAKGKYIVSLDRSGRKLPAMGSGAMSVEEEGRLQGGPQSGRPIVKPSDRASTHDRHHTQRTLPDSSPWTTSAHTSVRPSRRASAQQTGQLMTGQLANAPGGPSAAAGVEVSHELPTFKSHFSA